MDWTELLSTLTASWAILAVAGVGIAALPWSAADLGATRSALAWCVSWLRAPAAPQLVLAPAIQVSFEASEVG